MKKTLLKLARSGRPSKKRIHRFNVTSQNDAAPLLASLAADACRSGEATVLLIGRAHTYHTQVHDELRKRGIRVSDVTLRQVNDPLPTDVLEECNSHCIVLAETESQVLNDLAQQLISHQGTANIPLEYIALPNLEHTSLTAHDRFDNTEFVPPWLSRHGDLFYRIYEESLMHFEKKTDIRDYLDLAQCLCSLSQRGLTGAYAEFGSFKGHSGYLARRVMEALNHTAPMYLFDMFENFPVEHVGIDAFWSETHKVDFAQVKQQFDHFDNVQLIKGDFTKTLGETDTGPLSMAFIDCDAYRSTRHLLMEIWDQRLVTGGLVVLEDYGHPQLLGNRLAAHEFFDKRKDAFTWFSMFSGFFIALKLGEYD